MLLKGKKQNGVDRTLPLKISPFGVEDAGLNVTERKETKQNSLSKISPLEVEVAVLYDTERK